MTGFAVMCSGQGEQRADMFEGLLRQPGAAALLDRLGGALPQAARNWLAQPDADSLFTDAVSQPLICLRQILAWETVRAVAPSPDAFFGYSLGELSSYACAGAYPAEATLTLATERARLMDQAAEAAPSGLVAVKGLDETAVLGACAQHAGYLAIANGPEHFVVGATLDNLEALAVGLTGAGATTVVRLRVPLASHTPLLAQATQAFSPILEKQAFLSAGTTLFAGVSGDPVFTQADAVSALSRQISQTLRFDKVMDAAVAHGCRVFLELGPGTALSHILLETHPDLEARSVDEFAEAGKVGLWVEAALRRQG